MASADLSKDLECTLCLDIFTDPVTLRCGHNFCRGCIDRVLDTQEGSGGYSCPECREGLMERPALLRNIALSNIAESFLSTQPDQEETGVCCTYCIHSAVPAVMSCLHCKASLCDNHLRVHSKAPEHVLCVPNISLQNRKCSVHKKSLEYYCTEDAAFICVYCSAKNHRRHRVETLAAASEKKKKKLRNDLPKLMADTKEAKKRVQSLEERRRKAQDKADGETKRVTVLFRDLRRRLDNLEKRVLSDIIRQAQQVSQSYNDVIQQLEIKEEKLSRKIRHIEELCNMTDPLAVLQESDTGDLCDKEDRKRHDKQLNDGGDLDVAGISHTLHIGLSDIMSGVIVQQHTDNTQAYPHSSTEDKVPNIAKLPGPRPQPTPTTQHTQAYPHSSTEDKVPINATLSRPCPQPTPTAQHTQAYPHSSKEDKVPITAKLSRPCPQPTPTAQYTQHQAGGTEIGAAQQTSGLQKYADISLAVNTAANNLLISDDRKTASRTDRSQNRPETPKRFEEYQVLSSRRFSSGRHYWEVDVGRSDVWRVGMCYPSIARRGDQSWIGGDNKSWGLCGGYNQCSVIHDRKVIRVPDMIPSDRVRICLDYEAGQISFYALCDPIRLLHTFTAAFTEPLQAALWVYTGCVKISGRNQRR
ncbi:E3 ubiquitin/ISG15 ligase TRIM25-like [Hyperolius riggenbachi]|uniref:E3 ubiquitin/ISG15 ligase TRIM25-like n=1 Tax=Hyperolius riggenbachi TaxID=752182 RepID=UPI0035A2DF3B